MAVAESFSVETTTTGQGETHWKQNLKAYIQWHTSPNKATPPAPTQTVPPTGTRHSNIWACGGHSHSNAIILRKTRSRQEQAFLRTQRFNSIQLSFQWLCICCLAITPPFFCNFKMYSFLSLTCLKSVSLSSCHLLGLQQCKEWTSPTREEPHGKEWGFPSSFVLFCF